MLYYGVVRNAEMLNEAKNYCTSHYAVKRKSLVLYCEWPIQF